MTPAELRTWRTTARLTQAGLAVLLGIHPLTVSKWERGDRAIPPFLHLALEWLSCSHEGCHGGPWLNDPD